MPVKQQTEVVRPKINDIELMSIFSRSLERRLSNVLFEKTLLKVLRGVSIIEIIAAVCVFRSSFLVAIKMTKIKQANKIVDKDNKIQ